ncbi:Guanine nucleotide exchange factor DBS [Larimichthys crocea]|uniref:Uncharacterized protein n=1 Tax=Larimichthys crocea TaxID=215358 RepID=A0ACD3QWL4_LARCR|nr:Guanine nucleotide exchange factor DBS [Larimichthys crocea]
MRRATLFSLPVEMEMKMLRSGEESRQRDGMKESTGKQGYGGGERFACISLEEMKSFYRYTQCCQQLHNHRPHDYEQTPFFAMLLHVRGSRVLTPVHSTSVFVEHNTARTCGSQLSDWTVNKVLALIDDDDHLDECCALEHTCTADTMALNRVSQLCHDITRLWLQLKMMTDDILQRDDVPMCAAEIGSELQKQFAILPGGRGMNGNPIIVLPEFPAFGELEDEELFAPNCQSAALRAPIGCEKTARRWALALIG